MSHWLRVNVNYGEQGHPALGRSRFTDMRFDVHYVWKALHVAFSGISMAPLWGMPGRMAVSPKCFQPRDGRLR